MKIISLLFLLSITSETFSATIASTYRYTELADGGITYNEGAGPSFNVTSALMYFSYRGKITVQSDPGIPILNVFLRFQSNSDQPNVNYHFYFIGSSEFYYGGLNETPNLREISGTNLGLFPNELGPINRWEISWSSRTNWNWWGWANVDYQTIQGTAAIVVETEYGFDELATYPIFYAGGTLVPEVSVLGLLVFPCFIYVLQRRRIVRP